MIRPTLKSAIAATALVALTCGLTAVAPAASAQTASAPKAASLSPAQRALAAHAVAARAAAAKAAKVPAAVALGAKRRETGVRVLAVRSPHVAAASDATLSDLSVDSYAITPLSPSFSAATHVYEAVDSDDQSATVSPTATQSGAAVLVKIGTHNYPLSSGSATVPLARGRNDIDVTVTSSDGTQTSTYRATVWRHAAPTPHLVGNSQAHSSIYGGALVTLTMADGALPNNCYRGYVVNDRPGYPFTNSFDPTTGLTTELVIVPPSADGATGVFDMVVYEQCYLYNNGYATTSMIAPNAVKYTDSARITSADVPATVTSGSTITLHGTDIPAFTQISYWLQNAAGDTVRLNPATYSGEDTSTVYVNYGYGDSWYSGSGKRTLYAGYCPDYEPSTTSCKILLTKSVNWTAPAPTDLSFSPAGGAVAGGTTIRLHGRFLLSGSDGGVSIKVGDQTVSNWTTKYEADSDEGASFAEHFQGYDTIEFPAPASAVTGPVQITVTNPYGTTAARGTFTYSAKPAITAITPASVADTGGSVVTVTGSAFGASGRPTVIIDGVKSPYVTRISDTKLTAVVPASSTTGPVDVAVSSATGGGVSLPATLNLVAATTLPTIAKLTPASGHIGDDVTLTGSGFGPAGTSGVSVDGQWAVVTASTPNSISFQVPATDTTGAKAVVVGATTGTTTRTAGFTVLADDGIATVTPATVPSYATGNAATITLDGSGFGATGTVQVGAAKAVSYTATSAGTHIAAIKVSTATAGSLPIVVTPKGSTTPLRSSVFVIAPALTYVGSNPENDSYLLPLLGSYYRGFQFQTSTTGGGKMLLQGTGFGSSGTVKLGGTVVPTTSYTDTSITLTAPAHAAGTVNLTVTPAHSTLSAGYATAVQFVVPTATPPTLTKITSVVDHGYGGRNEFDPVNDTSAAFTLTGTSLSGSDPSKTRVVVSDGTNTFTVVPTAVTATSLSFAAPRGFQSGGWKDVQVTTDVGSDDANYGLYYLNTGVQLTISPYNGLCLRTPTAATGSVTYSPAVVTINNSGALFGTSGTVTIDGVTVTPTSYSSSQITFSMANLASDLTQPWGGKSIVITPSDSALATQQVGFTCGVTPSVTTTANGSTDALTVAAGTSYTLGYTTSGFIGANPFTATAPGGYEYVSKSDYDATGFTTNVHAGAPTGAGDYYVRVALSRASYATERYLAFTPAPVHVTITGTPITITPVSNSGASFTYKGQLGDGTNGTSTNFHYTPSSTTDPITAVVWEYRNSTCTTGAWTEGLPKDVAVATTDCGGDGTSRASWDVRVKSFTMDTTGTDRSIYYQATLPSTRITITPRSLTVSAVRADKVYDGTTTATLGGLTVTGAVDGDDIALANPTVAATFADATAGVNKAVTLGEDLTLSGAARGDYTLTNPHPSVVGTISKGAAVLALGSSKSAVLLSEHTPVTITPTLTDSRTNTAVATDANAAPVVLTSQTPTICTITGTTVTARAAGTCVIAGTEASSANYQAATAASDPTSRTETVAFQVFPAPQAISVIADDITVAVGDIIDPTSQLTGLFDGDTVDGVEYDYYSGHTLLTEAPTTPGNYKVVPHGGTLTAANTAAYSNPTSFTYVAGSLVITALPPTIDRVSPSSGTIAGGTTVTITGTRLDTVKSVQLGNMTLRAGDFTVSPDGTSLTFRTPKTAHPASVALTLVAGTATAGDVFTYVAPTVTVPGAPTHVVATGRDGAIAVSFVPPTRTGGAPITAYQVSTDGGHTWHTVTTRSGAHGTRTATVTGLENGRTYKVQVRAVNRQGAGIASTGDSATPVSPVTVPGAPTKVVAVGHDRQIALHFTAPTDNGGAAITAYQVSVDSGHTWHTVTTKSGAHGTHTATVTGVENGRSYSVQVRAVNRTGAGAASKAVTAEPAAALTAPAAPAKVTAIGHDRSITVRFTAPADKGGSRLTAYQASTDGGHTWHTVATKRGAHGTRTAVVRGVRNGVHYKVQLRAVNAEGPGRSARSNRVVPNSPALGRVRPGSASEVAVPSHPNRYHGPQRVTKAKDTSHNGTWAHPIPDLGTHQMTVGEAATLSKDSLFGFDSPVLTKEGHAEVKLLAEHLRLAHGVTCEGYTDYAGKAGHEQTLSAQRAHAVCHWLVHYGAHVHYVTHGYGGARPVVIGGSAVSRAANRRVVVIVTS